MSAVFLSSDAVLMLTQQLLALALLQQASEMIVLRHAWIDHGIWSLAILQDEFSGLPSPIRRTLCFLLAPRQFAFVLFALFGVAAMLLLGLSMHPALLSAALVLTSLVTVRFRGTFNGGSDYMTLVILSGLTVASLAPLAPWPNSGFPQLSPLAIDYIAVQSVLSYFIAGLVKLKEPRWRDGQMLRRFLSRPSYWVPNRLKAWICSGPPAISMSLSWLTIVFECSFPIAVINHECTMFYLLIGFVFHLGNAYALGLNLFLFIWPATYPALIFLAQSLDHRVGR